MSGKANTSNEKRKRKKERKNKRIENGIEKIKEEERKVTERRKMKKAIAKRKVRY